MPNTCMDRIENGVRTERFSFTCKDGFMRSASACIRPDTYKANINTFNNENGTVVLNFTSMNNLYDQEYYYAECTLKGSTNSVDKRSSYSSTPVVTVANLAPLTTYRCASSLAYLWPNGNVMSQGAFGNAVEFTTANAQPSGNSVIVDQYGNTNSILLQVGDLNLVSPQQYFANCYVLGNEGDYGVAYVTQPVSDLVNKIVNVPVNGLKTGTTYRCQAGVATPSNGGYTISRPSNFVNVATLGNTTSVPPSVQLASSPAATPFAGSEFSFINIHVGDTVDFTRTVKGSGIANSAWNWNFDKTKLSCAGYPDFDSDLFRCKAIASGESTVSITFTFHLKDGTQSTQESNLITVKTAASSCLSPYVMYMGSCVDSIPACKTPIPNSTSCIDKIVNGKYVEHYNFSCLSGYAKSGDRCVSGQSFQKYTVTSDKGNGVVYLNAGDKITFKSEIGENIAGYVSSLNTDVVINGKGYLFDSHNSVSQISGILYCTHYYLGSFAVVDCTVLKTAKPSDSSEVGVFTTQDCGTNGVCKNPLSNTITVKVIDSSADNEAIGEQEISENQPDLIISVAKGTLVKRFFKGGVTKKQYKIGVTVKNIGDGDADGPFYVSYSNSTQGTPVLVTNGTLGVDKTKKVFVYVDASEKGKKFTFTVDPGNSVDESNEENNTDTRIVGK